MEEDCSSISKENEDNNAAPDWSKCWVEIKDPKGQLSIKSERQSHLDKPKIDQEMLLTPMMTLNFSNTDKHNSDNLTNILSTHPACNQSMNNHKELKIQQARRLQQRIDQSIRKNQNQSQAAQLSNKENNPAPAHSEISVDKGLSSLQKLESFAANSSQAIQDLINSSKKILSLSSKKIQNNSTAKIDQPETSQDNQCLVVNYHSTIGHDSQEYNFQQVQDILTLHHESSMNTNCEQKINLIKQIKFQANDLNFK